jgi:ribosome modulation factor
MTRDERRRMARLRGAMAAQNGESVHACPADTIRKPWIEGWLSSAVSLAAQEPAIPGLYSVKQSGSWSQVERVVLEVAAAERARTGTSRLGGALSWELIGRLIGRSPLGVRLRAHRLEIKLGATAEPDHPAPPARRSYVRIERPVKAA